MLLEGKNAVIYGGGGNVGRAAVVAAAGTLDISLNVISDGDVQGIPMTEMTIEDYLRPIATAVTSKFFTSRAAARHMAPQGSGVIMAFGGATDPVGIKGYHYGGILAAFTGSAATFEDVGNVAAFAASDRARTMTGTAINLTCGTSLD